MSESLKEYGIKIKFKNWELTPSQLKSLPISARKNVNLMVELKKRSAILARREFRKSVFISLFYLLALIILLMWNNCFPKLALPKNSLLWAVITVVFISLFHIALLNNALYIANKIRVILDIEKFYVPLQKNADVNQTHPIFNRLFYYWCWGTWGFLFALSFSKNKLINAMIYHEFHPYKPKWIDRFYSKQINLKKHSPKFVYSEGDNAKERIQALKDFGIKVSYKRWELTSNKLKTLSKKEQKEVLFVIEFKKQLMCSYHALMEKIIGISLLFHLAFFAVVMMINDFGLPLLFAAFAYGVGLSLFFCLCVAGATRFKRTELLPTKEWWAPMQKIAEKKNLGQTFQDKYEEFKLRRIYYFQVSPLPMHYLFDCTIYFYFHPYKRIWWQTWIKWKRYDVLWLAERLKLP